MYRLDEYGEMIGDPARFSAYAEAIRRAVRPGDVVVDLGCGPGIFALLACRAGAAKVYAIDAGEVLPFARQLAAANSFSDRVVFLHSDSRQIQLPERANVVVSDVRGALPLFGEALPSIADARDRFLTEGGILIPQRDTVYAALLETPEYNRRALPWRNTGLSPALSMVLNSIYKARSQRSQLLSEPCVFCSLDYIHSFSPRAAADMCFRATRAGIGHGVTLWFETQLFEDVGFSAAPGSSGTVYGQGFLPWLEPVPLQVGQEIHVSLHADPAGGDYIWRWDTKIPAANGQPERIFRQSTFEGAPFCSESLRRRSLDYVPVLSDAGEAERWLLQAIDGVTPLREIAEAAALHFPSVFRRPEDAFRRLSHLAERFSR